LIICAWTATTVYSDPAPQYWFPRFSQSPSQRAAEFINAMMTDKGRVVGLGVAIGRNRARVLKVAVGKSILAVSHGSSPADETTTTSAKRTEGPA
jgi:hypothetical protein